MRRSICAGIAVLLLAAACSPGNDDNDLPTDPRGMEVVEAGWAAAAGRIGAAVRLHNPNPEPVSGVRVELAFVDDQGNELWSTEDILPGCPPSGDCWWATNQAAGEVGDGVQGVRADVLGVRRVGEGPELRGLDLRRDTDNDIVSEFVDEGGVTVVVVTDDTGPRWGAMLALEPDERVLVPEPNVPPLEGEQLHAFLYPGEGVDA